MLGAPRREQGLLNPAPTINQLRQESAPDPCASGAPAWSTGSRGDDIKVQQKR